MRKKILNISLAFITLLYCFAVFLCINVPFGQIACLPNKLNLNYQDIVEIKNNKPFGSFVSINLPNIVNASNGEVKTMPISFKLFNLITLKKVDVNIEDLKVYVGGNTVGFSLVSNGVIVIGNSEVMTEKGSIDTLKNADIKVGDIIVEIENQKIEQINDVSKIVNDENNRDKELSVKILRKNKEIMTTITPAKDIQTNMFKLGVWIKDNASGVGTLTYVRKDNMRFGALGHAITDNETKEPFNLSSGEMFACNVIGLNKGQKNKPGEVKAVFVQNRTNLGTVDKNTKYGIFGNYNEEKFKKLDDNNLKSVGGRLTAKPGKAKLRTYLDGKTYKDYDIEIVKTNYQNSSNEKSMVIRVVDKELLEKTGGIIQGMSGSPILQNDKIVGAITHVFISDPTKGFGVYIDWMIEQ